MSANKEKEKEKLTIIESFKNDKIYSKFFSSEFNVLEFTHNSINEQKLLENNAKLQEGIQVLNQELHTQVNEHYEDLLQQASIIRDLEDMLIIVRTGLESLENSVSIVKTELKDPYLQIKEKTQELEKIQNAAEILRKVLRFCFVCGKLRKHLGSNSSNTMNNQILHSPSSSPSLSSSGDSLIMSISNSRELPKAASCLYELEQIQKSFDLSGIDVVEREMEWILKIGQEIQLKAEQMLASGLETQNQSEVANSLQIFYNLKRLNQTINQTLSVIQEKALSSIRDVLESSSFDQGNSSQIIAWKTALWIRIEKLVDVLHQFCIQVWHLQKVLQKMRDPTTHSSLFDILVSELGTTITKSFWKTLSESISKEFIRFAQKSSFIESTLISDFPKLIRIFTEFLRRLQTNVEIKGAKESHFAEETTILMSGFSYFENLYMQKLSQRLLESIGRMFPGSKSAPSSEEVNNFSKLIFQELDLSQCGAHLYSSVSKYIAKMIQLFYQKCSSLVSTEQDAYQVSEKNSASQIRNCNIFNSVIVLHTSLVNLTKQAPSNVQQELHNPCESLYQLCCNILNPIFQKTLELFDRTLLTMHQIDYSSTENQLSLQSEPISRHIQILQKQIVTFKNVTIASYTYCPLLADKIKTLTEHILLFFVRHASLLRPLSDYGKLKLAGDTAQIELSIAPLRQVKTLGTSYQALRAFRPLLFKETEQILNSSEVKNLPLLDVCHHLLSRAPSEIKSPYERMGISIPKYSIWLDSHTEKDAWLNIQKSLDLYAKQVNDRGESHYDPVYPVLMELGSQIMAK